MSSPVLDRPRLREELEDFSVDEEPLYLPSGSGEHTFVRIEKRLRTTPEVAEDLARAAACRPREVGYAGRKDRRGVTRQWFSVPGLSPETAQGLEIPGVRILEAVRHPHKLRTGHLRGNLFEIRVRGIDAIDLDQLEGTLCRVRDKGLTNRFGHQRFGRRGDNAERARELLNGEPARGDRRAHRFLLSALQAEVFNRVLEQRRLPLDRVEPGDVAMVHRSGGLFVVEDEPRENSRAADFEISATGPIFGTKVKKPEGKVALLEAAVLSAHGIPPVDELRLPRGIRMRGTRRPFRVPVRELEWETGGGDLQLRFALPAGSYASVFVEEVVGEVDDFG